MKILSHPLAQPRSPKAEKAAPPSIGEASQMIFASEDVFRAIRMLSLAELVQWLESERRPERQRLINAVIGVRQAMR